MFRVSVTVAFVLMAWAFMAPRAAAQSPKSDKPAPQVPDTRDLPAELMKLLHDSGVIALIKLEKDAEGHYARGVEKMYRGAEVSLGHLDNKALAVGLNSPSARLLIFTGVRQGDIDGAIYPSPFSADFTVNEKGCISVVVDGHIVEVPLKKIEAWLP